MRTPSIVILVFIFLLCSCSSLLINSGKELVEGQYFQDFILMNDEYYVGRSYIAVNERDTFEINGHSLLIDNNWHETQVYNPVDIIEDKQFPKFIPGQEIYGHNIYNNGDKVSIAFNIEAYVVKQFI